MRGMPTKIIKFLKDRGYEVFYMGYAEYRHCCPFHKDDWYSIKKYKVSNGWYILCKVTGRPTYYLCANDNLSGIQFLRDSQDKLIEAIDGRFPEVKQK